MKAATLVVTILTAISLCVVGGFQLMKMVKQVNEPDPSTININSLQDQLSGLRIKQKIVRVVYVNRDDQSFVLEMGAPRAALAECKSNPKLLCGFVGEARLLAIAKGQSGWETLQAKCRQLDLK